jgi:undecaprenyl-diphosphatase
MISYFQAVILGVLQGVTELFPISSLGHSVILPKVLNWNVNQYDNSFLIFLVATHLATALVLFGFFFKDWMLIIKGIFRSIKVRKIDLADTYAKLGWLIIVGSIPAGVLGLLFEDKLKILFASPKYVSIFLILNGFLLFGAESLKRNIEKKDIHSDEEISKISWIQSIKIGFAQCLALIPGFSRTGSTIGGGLLIGLNHEDSARFSFLLATPIILAASVLKLPELLISSNRSIFLPTLIGFMSAGIAAYLSVVFLTKYFENKKLTPFAIYCIVFGIATFLFLIR